jgi:hypothetical protein
MYASDELRMLDWLLSRSLWKDFGVFAKICHSKVERMLPGVRVFGA